MVVSRPQVEKVQLKNGLTLLLFPVKGSFLCSIHLCLAMGNLFENKRERGLSSLMQEVIIKGTQSKDAILFHREIESLGASIESSSNNYVGKIAVEGPSKQIDSIISLFCEILKEPALKADEIEKEKHFLLGIVKALDDDPLKAAMLRFKKGFYGNHPFGTPSLGDPHCLQTFTQQNVVSWYQRWYVPNNMVIAVVGDYEPKKVKEKFFYHMEDLIPQYVPPFNPKKFTPFSSQVIEQKDIGDSWIVLGYQAPSLFDIRKRVAFEIMSNCLGGGMYSRVFLKLRERLGLSYQVGSVYLPFIGPSFICSYAGIPHQFFGKAVHLLRDEFYGLINVKQDEFEESKNFTRGMYLTLFETVYSISALLSFYERIGLGWEFPFQYQELLQSMTLDDALSTYIEYRGKGETLGAVVPFHEEKM